MLWRRLADDIVLALSSTMLPLMLHCALRLGKISLLKKKRKKIMTKLSLLTGACQVRILTMFRSRSLDPFEPKKSFL